MALPRHEDSVPLSDRARLLLREMVSGGCETDTARAKKLGWSRSKLYRVKAELAGRGVLSAGLEDEMEDLKVETPKRVSPVQDLVRHFVKKRWGDQKPPGPMYKRYCGEAKNALRDIDLQDMKNCIDWLCQEAWWKDKSWGIAAAAGTGWEQYQKYRKRQQRLPGADESLRNTHGDHGS